MMWLWWAIPAAYLAVAAMAQPSMAMDRYADLADRFKNAAGKREASTDAFWLALIWPITLTMMRGNRTIQAALDAEQQRVEARKQIADHNREQAQREANEFERQLNGTDGLPKHVKAGSLNLAFIGAHVAGTGSYGGEFKGKLEGISFGSSRDPLHIRVSGEYKYPNADTILTINGGRA